MLDDNKARRTAAREAALKTMGLVVLLARGDGRLTFTQDEYDSILARYGGSKNFAIHMEILATKSGEDREVQLSLIRKPAANAELVS